MTTARENPDRLEPLAYTVDEAVRVSGLGRTTLYRLAGEKRITIKKIGRRTLITAASLRSLLEAA
jgi:excisionase family DNA binding protein